MFWNRQYKLWVINTTAEATLYQWDTWKLIMPSIEAFLSLSPKDAYIRTCQSFEFENRWLGFGRMKWGPDSNIKWTTKYRTEENRHKLQFYSTEVWAPDWNACIKDSTTPDIYVQIQLCECHLDSGRAHYYYSQAVGKPPSRKD